LRSEKTKLRTTPAKLQPFELAAVAPAIDIFEIGYDIYVQAGTPDAIVERINDGINRALQNPDVQRRLAVANIPGKPMPLKDLAALMKADHEKLTKVIATSGMALQ
jgi:tripartite-type tricarboxylate transporter receptor subunit TctC